MRFTKDIFVGDNEAPGSGVGGGDPAEINAIKSDISNIFSIIYTPPTVALTLNPATATREFGETVSATTISSTVTRKTQNITKVEFFRDNNLLNTVASPNANGGTFTFANNAPMTTTTTFRVKATDVMGSAEASRTVTFVYPMYAGAVSVAAPNEAQVKALSKLVRTKGDTPHSFTSAGQRFAFAYPASYGNLRSITDPNGFETLGSYTATTINITGLDGTAVSYRVYTLSTTTTQTNFTNTFKF